MSEGTEKNFRKISRNFKERVELMKRTPLKELEKMSVEMFEYGVRDYIRTEREMHPNKSKKEIIIEMYKLREKLKGRKIKK